MTKLDPNVIKKISQIAGKVSEKILIQVEGSTCSGKTSFVLDSYATLVRQGVDVLIIEEAAAKILREHNNLLEQLSTPSQKSKHWREAKIELQQRVLSEQIECLEQFAENDQYRVAIMDRGGASTAYHTIPFFSNMEKDFIERICKELAKMGSQILFLSPLGFLDKDSPRYQNTVEEIELEDIGIKYYLDRWSLKYIEITSYPRKIRVNIGVKHILDYLKRISNNLCFNSF